MLQLRQNSKKKKNSLQSRYANHLYRFEFFRPVLTLPPPPFQIISIIKIHPKKEKKRKSKKKNGLEPLNTHFLSQKNSKFSFFFLFSSSSSFSPNIINHSRFSITTSPTITNLLFPPSIMRTVPGRRVLRTTYSNISNTHLKMWE